MKVNLCLIYARFILLPTYDITLCLFHAQFTQPLVCRNVIVHRRILHLQHCVGLH